MIEMWVVIILLAAVSPLIATGLIVIRARDWYADGKGETE